MLYHNGEKLTKDKFQNPGSEYRAAPFWAWNCRMTKPEIDNTLDALKAMGMGGGHIHCRTGMDNPYMGEEFLELVKYSWKRARKKTCSHGFMMRTAGRQVQAADWSQETINTESDFCFSHRNVRMEKKS